MSNKEVFKDVVGYEGMYQVSNTGRVKSLGRTIQKKNGMLYNTKAKMLKLGVTGKGYYGVKLCKGRIKTRTIHQLMAEVFLGHTPNRYKIVVDHKNNDKLDNRLANLQLISPRENSTKDIKRTLPTGVYLKKGNRTNPYYSRIQIKGKREHLGMFKTPELASKAYQNKLNDL